MKLCLVELLLIITQQHEHNLLLTELNEYLSALLIQVVIYQLYHAQVAIPQQQVVVI